MGDDRTGYAGNELAQNREVVAAPIAARGQGIVIEVCGDETSPSYHDPELHSVVDAWSGLPQHLKAAILSIVGQMPSVP